MLNIALKINPFTNEVSVLKDGKSIKPTNRLATFYKSFINTSFNLRDIILEDENIDNFHVSLETSMFEKLFLDILSGSNSCKHFSVVRKDFLVNTAIEKRISTLLDFRKHYPDAAQPIPPIEIGVYAQKKSDAEKLICFYDAEYPWLKEIGITFSSAQRVSHTQINLFSDVSEVASNSKFLSAVDGDLYPLVFLTHGEELYLDENEESSSSDNLQQKDDIIIWDIAQGHESLVLRTFLERYFIYPQINRIIANFAPPISAIDNFDEYVDFQLLNKVFETVVVQIPSELEKDIPIKVPIKTFFGDKQPIFKVSSAYRDIVDVACNNNIVDIKPLAVGDSDVKLEIEGEPTPIVALNIKVVDYGYAKSAQIFAADSSDKRRFITTPGLQVKLTINYEPQTLKASEDAKNAHWIVSDEKCGSFDSKTMMFHAKAPGNVAVLAKLARVQASFPIIIKPNVIDYTLSVINESDNHIQEIKKGGNEQSVEYVKCYIATFLRFKLERHPVNAINAPISIEFTDGVSVEKNPEETEFVVNARRVAKGETLKISLPGCDIVKTVVIDIVANPGSLSKDNRAATLIAASVITAIISVLGAIFLSSCNIYLLAFIILSLAFNVYTICKAEKNIRLILIVFAAIVFLSGGYSVAKKYINPERHNFYQMPPPTSTNVSGNIQNRIVNPPITSSPSIKSKAVTISQPVQVRPVVQPEKTLPAMKPSVEVQTLSWLKLHRQELFQKYVEAQKRCQTAKKYEHKYDAILYYNEIVDQIKTDKQTYDAMPVKAKDLDDNILSKVEQEHPELYETYKKTKRSIRNRRIIFNKAKKDGAMQTKLNQLQGEINEVIFKFNDIRQEIINIYHTN